MVTPYSSSNISLLFIILELLQMVAICSQGQALVAKDNLMYQNAMFQGNQCVGMDPTVVLQIYKFILSRLVSKLMIYFGSRITLNKWISKKFLMTLQKYETTTVKNIVVPDILELMHNL